MNTFKVGHKIVLIIQITSYLPELVSPHTTHIRPRCWNLRFPLTIDIELPLFSPELASALLLFDIFCDADGGHGNSRFAVGE